MLRAPETKVSLGERSRCVGETASEQQVQEGRANPARQFSPVPEAAGTAGAAAYTPSSESKSAHTDVYFFQEHSFLAAVFAVLSDLLPWRDDIPVLSLTASSSTGCTAPCKHPQL